MDPFAAGEGRGQAGEVISLCLLVFFFVLCVCFGVSLCLIGFSQPLL